MLKLSHSTILPTALISVVSLSCEPIVDHQTPEHLRSENPAYSPIYANKPQASPISSTYSTSQYKLPELSKADKIKLGKKIWMNESSGKVSGLTHWNVGEEFPSMGIGHFILYPKGFDGRWTETFPLFVKYAQSKNAKGLPIWVQTAKDCPWNSREEFLKNINDPRLVDLRNFFKNNVALQTEFIIQKSRGALSKMLAAAPQKDRAKLLANYKKVATTLNGTYALIDYENFKGDGTNPRERYKGQGWGMTQVLLNMKETSGGQASAKAFAESAKAMLLRRVKNSPPARGEKRWTAGWNNRCDTYARPL